MPEYGSGGGGGLRWGRGGSCGAAPVGRGAAAGGVGAVAGGEDGDGDGGRKEEGAPGRAGRGGGR
ncbi:hypothetical protein B7R22_12620 [Subtercola boreus]|uniref:Uncharacterized protein n=1 Tax=Subtercola boreus TaxID=120213 RepID=A0A3E0VVW1_9MICO|nr:hypothetical protein B7R22_12620 [Subtercola boreus]